jgi:hypothetical protein
LAALIASLNQTDATNPADRKRIRLRLLFIPLWRIKGRALLTFGKRFCISCSPDVSETFTFDDAIEKPCAAR